MSDDNKQSLYNNKETGMSQFELMQKVRSRMNQLYSALDSFKSDLIGDAAELVQEQIQAFGRMVERTKKPYQLTKKNDDN